MQNQNSSKKYFIRDKSKPWYKNPSLSIGCMLLCTAVWFVCGVRTLSTNDFETKRLILRSEGCAYLQIHNLQTQHYSIANTCMAEVPFKYMSFSNTGVIWADDGKNNVFVNGSQIVAVEALPDQPWPAERRRNSIYVAIGTLFYMSIMFFLFATFDPNKNTINQSTKK